jgi:hypothetical protein
LFRILLFYFSYFSEEKTRQSILLTRICVSISQVCLINGAFLLTVLDNILQFSAEVVVSHLTFPQSGLEFQFAAEQLFCLPFSVEAVRALSRGVLRKRKLPRGSKVRSSLRADSSLAHCARKELAQGLKSCHKEIGSFLCRMIASDAEIIQINAVKCLIQWNFSLKYASLLAISFLTR